MASRLTVTKKSGSALWRKLKPKARAMRHEPTEAEAMLWEALRARRLHGFKFRRQHVIGRFIADFYCAEARLIVEVDGGVHDERGSEDRVREDALSELGLTVLRFTNDMVLENMNQVLEEIRRFSIAARNTAARSPSPRRFAMACGEGVRG